MAKRDIEAGRAFITMALKDANFRRSLREMRRHVNVFGTAAIAGFTAVSVAIGLMIKEAVAAGDKFHKMSIRTRTAVEDLSALAFAAEQSGTDIENLSSALIRMNRRVANASLGTGPAVRALKELGINAGDLAKLRPENQMKILADALKGVGNEGVAAQFAFELFGDNFKAIIPLLREGSDGIDRLKARAVELGITMSGDQADAAAKFADSLNEVNKQLEAVRREIAHAFIPAVENALNQLKPIISGVIGAMEEEDWEGLGEIIGLALQLGIQEGLKGLSEHLNAILSGDIDSARDNRVRQFGRKYVPGAVAAFKVADFIRGEGGGGALDTTARGINDTRDALNKKLAEKRQARERRIELERTTPTPTLQLQATRGGPGRSTLEDRKAANAQEQLTELSRMFTRGLFRLGQAGNAIGGTLAGVPGPIAGVIQRQVIDQAQAALQAAQGGGDAPGFGAFSAAAIQARFGAAGGGGIQQRQLAAAQQQVAELKLINAAQDGLKKLLENVLPQRFGK